MKFTLAAVAALLSTAAVAAPLEERQEAAVNMMVTSTPQWTMAKFQRVCNSANTSCKYSFNINTHTGPVTPCSYTVTGNNAADASVNGKTCGVYTVSSNWSGQFGPGNGFTTLAVVNNQLKQIIYPAYKDTQLKGNQVVSPNQSYTPQNLG